MTKHIEKITRDFTKQAGFFNEYQFNQKWMLCIFKKAE